MQMLCKDDSGDTEQEASQACLPHLVHGFLFKLTTVKPMLAMSVEKMMLSLWLMFQHRQRAC